MPNITDKACTFWLIAVRFDKTQSVQHTAGALGSCHRSIPFPIQFKQCSHGMSCPKQRQKLHLQLGTRAKTFRPVFIKQKSQIIFAIKSGLLTYKEQRTDSVL
jgi:hypothetical protein